VFAASSESDHASDASSAAWRDEPAPVPGPSTPPRPSPRLDPTDEDDRQLVLRVQRQEPGAWPELVHRYQHRLYAVCLKTLGNRQWAADCCQDAFVRLIQKIDAYDGRSRFSTWAIRVTMNICLSKLRSEKLRRHAPLPHDHPSASGVSPGVHRRSSTSEPVGISGVEQVEASRRLARALAELPDDQRGLLLLRDVQGLEYAQIAAALDIPVGTVKSRLFRARQALRTAIESAPTREGSNEPPRTD